VLGLWSATEAATVVHLVTAGVLARALAASCVRCPFADAPTRPVYDRKASFAAEHGDQYYRVSRAAHGD